MSNPRITEQLLNRVEAHLDAILVLQALPRALQASERAMLARLRSGNTTRQDIEFYLHELIESAKFRRTGDLKHSHEEALKFKGVTERDLFHPDVIRQYPCFLTIGEIVCDRYKMQHQLYELRGKVQPGDKVLPYLILHNSHDGTGAVWAQFTPVRVVCWNTFQES